MCTGTVLYLSASHVKILGLHVMKSKHCKYDCELMH